LAEPTPATQYKELEYWLVSNNKGYKHQSLGHIDDPKNPFKILEGRKFDWDDDNTLELRDNFSASSGAFLAAPRDNHWTRFYVQANNKANLWDSVENVGLVDVSYSYGMKDDLSFNSDQILSVGDDDSGIISTDDDGYFEVVLIGRSGANPRDLLAIDVDEDWGWEYQGKNINAFRMILNGDGGSDSTNWETNTWITLLDYGTCRQLNGATIPYQNSMGIDVDSQGLSKPHINGFEWSFEDQSYRALDDSGNTDFDNDDQTTQDDDDDDNTQPDPDPNPNPPQDVLFGFEAMYDQIKNGEDNADNPFSIFSIYGADSQHDFITSNELFVNNNDVPFRDSGAALLEVKEGMFVELRITNQANSFFSDIAVSMSLDTALVREDFNGGDSDFTVRLYGGNVLYVDPDNDYGDAVASFGGGFFLSTESSSYAIAEPADNDYIIELIDHGVDERKPDPSTECDDGFVWDPVNQMCIPINGGGDGGDVPTDPFEIIDGIDTPFDEDDGLVDRLIKSITFGINNSFKAIEAAFEGFVIALPALIVIGSAVIAARLAIGATEKGASKLIGVATKAKDSITDVKIEGVA
jgi:hypothetical protein